MPPDIGTLAPLKRESHRASWLSGFHIRQLGGDDGKDTLPLLRAQLIEGPVALSRERKALLSPLIFGGRMGEPFRDSRTAALALLNGGSRLTRSAGSFLGQLAAEPTALSEKQSEWLATLLDRAGLPRCDCEVRP